MLPFYLPVLAFTKFVCHKGFLYLLYFVLDLKIRVKSRRKNYAAAGLDIE